jgi:hypothetical protein
VTTCAPHREFLAAIADGETDLIPAATIDHVQGCADCAREIRSHQLITSRLRQAGDLVLEAASGRRAISWLPRRLPAIAAGVAGAILIATAGAVWLVLSRPDPVLAAVTASSQPLQIESTDPSQVDQWCLHASGRTLPAVQIDGMHVVGARMDKVAMANIVTVVYTAPSGGRVAVSWVEGQAPQGSGVEKRNLSGHELLIVHSAVGTAVVMGSSADEMWQAAAAIESTRKVAQVWSWSIS